MYRASLKLAWPDRQGQFVFWQWVGRPAPASDRAPLKDLFGDGKIENSGDDDHYHYVGNDNMEWVWVKSIWLFEATLFYLGG